MALVVAPKLVMPALAIVSERAPVLAIVSERAPVLAAKGEIPAHLVVGLAGMAAPVVPSIGGGRTRNRTGRDQGGGAEGENRK